MNILIFAANWNNRGDESAIRAMIDELKLLYPAAQFKIHFTMRVSSVPYDEMEIIPSFGNVQRRYVLQRLQYKLSIKTCGRINIMPRTRKLSAKENRVALKRFVEAVQWCDLAIYAPGGPCIGDLYRAYGLLDCIDLMRYDKKPYVFYAPSMGPFKQYKRRIAKILHGAAVLCLREGVSAGFVKDLVPNVDIHITLDSAFQHPVDEKKYDHQLKEYTQLVDFLNCHDKVVGITITDLQWHSKYAYIEVKNKIKVAFNGIIEYLTDNGYGVVFIPQLFNCEGDKDYMESFAINNCFVVDDEHDCYFQQYLISKLYAVIGMRYHSNIFSAKMGTPFVSVAYEQKMSGFAQKVGLSDFCFSINDLSKEKLIEYFEKLVANYNSYNNKLFSIREWCRTESYKTTQYVQKVIEDKGLNH